jgi:hypothetical protein
VRPRWRSALAATVTQITGALRGTATSRVPVASSRGSTSSVPGRKSSQPPDRAREASEGYRPGRAPGCRITR